MAIKKRGCLITLGLGAVLLAVVVVLVGLFLPGDLSFGSRPSPAVATAASGPAGVASPVVPAPPLAPPAPSSGGWMTYLVPADILETELRKAFPIRQNVVDLVKLTLDRPTFLTDTDPAFLRLQIEVEARVVEGDQRLPGTAIVRTQLAYDRAARTVTLRNAQLIDLRFTGDGALFAGALQPVLSAALAAEMEGYPIFEVPEDGLWWLKAGIAFVRDVYVKDGRVAIALGP